MKQFDLSDLILSMAKSVDDAVADMKRAGISCELEEFECTVTLETELDTEIIGVDEEERRVRGLRFLEVRKAMFPKNQSKSLNEPHPEKGALTFRAVFSPGSVE
jgi:hypothetical protein